jgi:hypothetical protein
MKLSWSIFIDQINPWADSGFSGTLLESTIVATVIGIVTGFQGHGSLQIHHQNACAQFSQP